VILLDTGVLGYLCHPSREEESLAVRQWFELLVKRGAVLAVPEIADYELRRGLLRTNNEIALARLDRFGSELDCSELDYLPITTTVMRRAAHLWAESRLTGRSTAHDKALDGDVILAAQAKVAELSGERVTIATTNPRHLKWFVDARTWDEIKPETAVVRFRQ
jgi:predicted nucleic acid-binding protein